jgi:hypothetical protein
MASQQDRVAFYAVQIHEVAIYFGEFCSWCFLRALRELAATNMHPLAPPRPVVIDTDTGVDDAIAMLIALRASAAVQPVAVVTVCGNVGVDAATLNAAAVLRSAPRPLHWRVLHAYVPGEHPCPAVRLAVAPDRHCGRDGEVLLYRGASEPLIGKHDPAKQVALRFHKACACLSPACSWTRRSWHVWPASLTRPLFADGWRHHHPCAVQWPGHGADGLGGVGLSSQGASVSSDCAAILISREGSALQRVSYHLSFVVPPLFSPRL